MCASIGVKASKAHVHFRMSVFALWVFAEWNTASLGKHVSATSPILWLNGKFTFLCRSPLAFAFSLKFVIYFSPGSEVNCSVITWMSDQSKNFHGLPEPCSWFTVFICCDLDTVQLILSQINTVFGVEISVPFCCHGHNPGESRLCLLWPLILVLRKSWHDPSGDWR